METTSESISSLRQLITDTEKQLKILKSRLSKLEEQESEPAVGGGKNGNVTHKWPLSPEEYKRYGRQMIVPNFGIEGQLRLKKASVLIIGAGGLGCPSSVYLAGAGVGTIGIVDGDTVETSNLHRQILHNSSTIGMKKVDSIIAYLKSLNLYIKYNSHPNHLTPANAAEIVRKYDLVLDCTDHPTSRYLISDICILLHKPLISASALRTDGQLITLNSPPLPPGNPNGGPCYRCIFPKPPPADSVVSCGDGGILGPVVGVMGVLQALEAVKLIVAGKLTYYEEVKNAATTMLLFSSNGNPQFRSLKMRARSPKCVACSPNADITLERLPTIDYAFFCGLAAPVDILKSEERIEAMEYERSMNIPHLLVDVREKIQFDICNIEGSVNVPFSTLQESKYLTGNFGWVAETLPSDAPIYIVCRLGNDSQVAVKRLQETWLGKKGNRSIKDIKGGLKSWKDQVDNSWPEY